MCVFRIVVARILHCMTGNGQWRSQPDIWSCKCKFSSVYTPYKATISKEMNNDNDLNLHSMTKWTDCIMGKILKKVEIGKFITTALKSILNLVKLQSLVAKRCKMWKM